MRGVQLMHDYAVSLGMLGIEEDVTFHLYHNHVALFAAYARVRDVSEDFARDHWDDGDGTGEAGNGWIFVNTSGSWVRKEPLFSLMKMPAHELFHTYQQGLSGLSVWGGVNQVPEAGPRWLSEGTAEYFAYRAMDAGGEADFDKMRNSTDPWGFVKHAEYVDRRLSEMETWTGFSGARGDITSYAVMAAELLASRTGEKSLIQFYSLTQPGTTWQEAFEQAFGMNVEEFYDLFEEHREAGFPELEAPE